MSSQSSLVLTTPIVLVGLMGAGKSSVGRRLAQHLRVRFADSDTEVEAAAALSIPDIFTKYGEPEFRRLERAVIARIIGEARPMVLATGGGAFMDAETRETIAQGALTVWINAEVATLWTRVASKPGRPLLSTPDPLGTLTRLAQERYPVYATADVTVLSEPDQPHEVVVDRIIAALRDKGALHEH